MARARIVKVSVIAATAALLAGCAQHPGAAAVVGDETITDARVDDVAAAICSANAGASASGQPLASRGARQAALQVLLDSELSRQFGEAKGIKPSDAAVSQAVARSRQTIDALPEDQRDDFREALSDYAAGQYIVVDAGRLYLASQGKTNAPDKQAAAAGTQLRAKFAKTLDVEVDPRYGSFDPASGSLGSNGGSLSVPASAFAMDGASPDPSAGWVSSLPAAQKCG